MDRQIIVIFLWGPKKFTKRGKVCVCVCGGGGGGGVYVMR